MRILVGIVLASVCVFVLLKIRHRQRTTVRIDGNVIRLVAWRDEVTIYCKEPIGRVLTFDAFWSGPKRDRSLLQVEFPHVLSVPNPVPLQDGQKLVDLKIPDATPTPIPLSGSQVEDVKAQLARGLTKLGIPHEFVHPQSPGWTSFENGQEIHHG